jgi:hypothetical protein
MREQHLDLFAHSSRGPALPRFCNLARHVAGTLIDGAGHLSSRRVGAARGLENTSCAVAFARTVEDCRFVIHQSARRGQLLAARTEVDVALVIIGEVVA